MKAAATTAGSELAAARAEEVREVFVPSSSPPESSTLYRGESTCVPMVSRCSPDRRRLHAATYGGEVPWRERKHVFSHAQHMRECILIPPSGLVAYSTATQPFTSLTRRRLSRGRGHARGPAGIPRTARRQAGAADTDLPSRGDARPIVAGMSGKTSSSARRVQTSATRHARWQPTAPRRHSDSRSHSGHRLRACSSRSRPSYGRMQRRRRPRRS
jgi:hypothetical protein